MNVLGHGSVVAPGEWAEISTPDVYFTKDYHATSALADPDFTRSVLLEWTDEGGSCYLPLMLRAIKGQNYFDATSAYGYGGPWFEGQPDLLSFRAFFDDWARDNHVVSSFLRFHPLLNNAERFLEILPVKQIGQTAVWNLDGSDGLVEGMAKNHRKSWRRAVRAGLEARVTKNPDDVDGFRSLYELSMGRLSADRSYWLSDKYWTSLRDTLGKDSLLVEAVYQDRVVAAVWCLVSDDYLHFHLSGTTDAGRRLGGAFICRVAAAQWAQEAGKSQAHFGGGVGGTGSSLLDWKRRFDESARLLDFSVANVIHDEESFARLAEGYPRNGFFPPWRDPRGKTEEKS